MRILWTSTKALLVFTVLTGLLYPLLITGVGFLAFRDKASGSLLRRGSIVVGSKLLAQKVEDPAYFWFRPSAGDFATVASGASNLSPASSKFLEAVETRRKAIGDSAPAELLMASGSGLDPEISRAGALYQVERISERRGLAGEDKAKLKELVEASVEKRTLGVLGQERVNVMLLNHNLDEVFPKR